MAPFIDDWPIKTGIGGPPFRKPCWDGKNGDRTWQRMPKCGKSTMFRAIKDGCVLWKALSKNETTWINHGFLGFEHVLLFDHAWDDWWRWLRFWRWVQPTKQIVNDDWSASRRNRIWCYGGFQSMGVPPVIDFSRIVHELNHPAGVSRFQDIE